MKKKDLLKAGSTIGLFAGGMGLSILNTKLLSVIWEKRPLTEEFVEEHPWVSFGIIMFRIIWCLGSAVALIVAPVYLLAEKVEELIDKHFPDKKEDFE